MLRVYFGTIRSNLGVCVETLSNKTSKTGCETIYRSQHGLPCVLMALLQSLFGSHRVDFAHGHTPRLIVK